MNKEQIQKQIEALDKEIAELITDKTIREKVDERIRLQKALDVVPVELMIECEDVLGRYPVTDSVEVVRCKTAIFLHTTCFWVVAKPTLANNGRGGALYEILNWYCDYMENWDEYEGEERENYDTVCMIVGSILTLPLDAFTDMDFCTGIANDILTRRTAYYERLDEEANKERPETVEDLLKNAEYVASVAAGQEILDELAGLAKKTS